jgi:hypothetical protein
MPLPFEAEGVTVILPLSYLEMLLLEGRARLIPIVKGGEKVDHFLVS